MKFCRLCGESAFAASTVEKIFKRNEQCEIRFPDALWKSVSSEAKDLVIKMTEKNPEKRITIDEALNHPWFIKDTVIMIDLSSALENMKKYNNEYFCLRTNIKVH